MHADAGEQNFHCDPVAADNRPVRGISQSQWTFNLIQNSYSSLLMPVHYISCESIKQLKTAAECFAQLLFEAEDTGGLLVITLFSA